MTADSVGDAEERTRLSRCAAEPIHRPGAVQPHGVLLALDPTTATVVQFSANAGQVLGLPAEGLLGKPLGGLLEEGDAADLARALADVGRDATPVPVRVGGALFDAVVHRSPDGLDVVELEPTTTVGDAGLLGTVHAGMQRLSRARTVSELRTEAARVVRGLTGFDRVMVYHFHADGHGEVVAEDRSQDMEPYLGLHYPASDIPAQARRLYLLRGCRIIPSTAGAPAALVPVDNPLTGRPTDLGLAQLRSVSPHHLTFMANMGVAASMSVSLVHDGELVGMISCGHRTPWMVRYEVRRACEMLAQQVTLQMRALGERERLERRLALQGIRTRVVEGLTGSADTAAALVHGATTVRDLMPADGVAVRVDGRVAVGGDVPPPEQVRAIVDALQGRPSTDPLVTDSLRGDRPDLAAAAPDVAGCVVAVLGEDDYLAWFRRPIAQTVEWLGDQSAQNRDTPLSPRNSFHRWRRTVTDQTAPWDDAEVLEVGVLAQLTAQHLAGVRTRRATARAALTARVATELAEVADADAAVAQLARLVVPDLADWSVITLVEEGPAGGPRGLRDVGWWHRDEAARPLVERYVTERLAALQARSPFRRTARASEVTVKETGATAAIQAFLAEGPARELIGALAPDAFAVLPLRGRDRTLGVMSLYNGRSRGPISAEFLATAREVAGRAGLALDNARLYRRQLEIAEGLQRAMLTDPPRIERAEIAVRFSPAAEAVQVGGDWYDAFALPDGRTVLVIGDVAGHDTTAAAAMGQLRSLVRGIAVDSGAGPADVLERVDRATRTLQADTIATAVVAQLETSTDGARTVLRWSNAGHPPPMLITPGGAVVVADSASQLLLGAAPDTVRQEATWMLAPGSTVFLYTDGLVERRGEGLEAGIERLGEALSRFADLPLEEMCDRVLAELTPDRPEDDVAVLAVRLQR